MAATPVTLHGVVFDILVVSENRVAALRLSFRDDRKVACRAVARVQRGPPPPDGLWRGSLWHAVVTHVLGTIRYLRLRAGQAFHGERGGTRTLDPMIKSHVLYRLSYALTCRAV